MLSDFHDVTPTPLRQRIRDAYLIDEADALGRLLTELGIGQDVRAHATERARKLVEHIRGNYSYQNLMETFLGEYGLTDKEGIALMCLAEALLRVPDTTTIDALIQDKIGGGNWRRHLGRSPSVFVNASTWGLMLAGAVVGDDDNDLERSLLDVVRRLGEPIVREAVVKSIKILGNHFVLGATIEEAIERSRDSELQGYRFSYDMLGEAAKTQADADRYYMSYAAAITGIAKACDPNGDARSNPGISIKLSALHPRYEFGQRGRVKRELTHKLIALASLAKAAKMGLNIDAEEADRLELSLDIFADLLDTDALKDWDGLGFVVQAYQKRAPFVLDWLIDAARGRAQKLMIRLVKGAYWDAEIKHHQVLGVDGYPVFTHKSATDVSYVTCAKKLFQHTDVIYPQFATHNARTVSTILELAKGQSDFEFQRLQGMGEALHDQLVQKEGMTSRIYAPVGVHKDLLAYLVRRLLENGANSSFVNQVVNPDIEIDEVIADPISAVEQRKSSAHDLIPFPCDLYGGERTNSRGLNLTSPMTLNVLKRALADFAHTEWSAFPTGAPEDLAQQQVFNPAQPEQVVGQVRLADIACADAALKRARDGFGEWSQKPVNVRAQTLIRASDLLEQRQAELMALCIREAGKTLDDAIAEIREAVDFLRYYAEEATGVAHADAAPAGVFVCISPWNFPLAIFLGQVSAALVMGNTVVAKPAEQTSLIAALAVELLHEAGVPGSALQLVPGSGAVVGAHLVACADIAGVCFTGSTAVAQSINRAMATHGNTRGVLVAETGGINAMIIDSTALPEQAVTDIVASAFQSAGQRCSALRLLFVQEDVADHVLAMLKGAMEELRVGDPAMLETDIGPVIDAGAKKAIDAHVAGLHRDAKFIAQAPPATTSTGHYVTPVAFELSRSDALTKEIFGPVLHVCRFAAEEIDETVRNINALGYGLTLGVHSRITATIERICDSAEVGNIYVNRNQIGAVVGVQPFGGERQSGTGPKAGGPNYLRAFTSMSGDSPDANGAATFDPTAPADVPRETFTEHFDAVATVQPDWDESVERGAKLMTLSELLVPIAPQSAPLIANAAQWAVTHTVDAVLLKGPTGEENRLSYHGRGVILCLGDAQHTLDSVLEQTGWALAAGNAVLAPIGQDVLKLIKEAGLPQGLVRALPAGLARSRSLLDDERLDGVAFFGSDADVRYLRSALAARNGPILPIIDTRTAQFRYFTERTTSIDTTASGGNAALLALTE
ncbi:MAG: bifunctional proline dehydrogenase/L-glutamate gamma-semialdehyde dehydrogenase PutA [Gammaproteobacteria bacterium]|nr:bifunctional proline dehydrogenase/L-glutamate gamma-semialdehyde dehydrogenase PutA [Gammaproteobacteria bacterium]